MSNLPPTAPRQNTARGSNPTSSDTAVTELFAPLAGGESAPAKGTDGSGAHVVGANGSAARATDAPSTSPIAAETVPGTARPGSGPRNRPFASVFAEAPERTALVVLVALVAIALAFIILVVVGVTNQSINALAVIVAPIAAMVAAYYGITLSIQQVKNERAEKQKAMDRADAAQATGRETEIWAGQMESGLRVAMAKLNAAGINTDEVTKAAGTPADFF